jgi:hypothetical protein
VPPLAQRFEAKVDRRGEHHLWLGATDHRGVGLIRVDGVLTTARRVAWELGRGPLPHGQRVAGCPGDPRCVRVEHLGLLPQTTPPKRPAPVRRRGPRGAGTKVEVRPGVWKLTVGHRGTRHHRTFEGNDDQATRALATFADEIHLAARRDAPTLDGLVLGYLDHLAATGYAPTTIARYESLHRQWILPGIGRRRLRRVFNADIQELLDTMADHGQSASSIRQARALLTGAYRWGQQRGTISANPALDIEWPWEDQ